MDGVNQEIHFPISHFLYHCFYKNGNLIKRMLLLLSLRFCLIIDNVRQYSAYSVGWLFVSIVFFYTFLPVSQKSRNSSNLSSNLDLSIIESFILSMIEHNTSYIRSRPSVSISLIRLKVFVYSSTAAIALV